MQPPDCCKIKVGTDKDGYWDSYRFRLMVVNDGRVGARMVEVRLLSLSIPEKPEEQAGGEHVQDSFFIPLNLVWSNYDPAITVLPFLPPGERVGKHCDFCHVVNMEPRFLEFETQMTPNKATNDDNSWPTRKLQGKYYGTLTITADNAKAAYFDFTVTYKNWNDEETEMFSENGLTVTLRQVKQPMKLRDPHLKP